jgi:hypothetical protein
MVICIIAFLADGLNHTVDMLKGFSGVKALAQAWGVIRVNLVEKGQIYLKYLQIFNVR